MAYCQEFKQSLLWKMMKPSTFIFNVLFILLKPIMVQEYIIMKYRTECFKVTTSLSALNKLNPAFTVKCNMHNAYAFLAFSLVDSTTATHFIFLTTQSHSHSQNPLYLILESVRTFHIEF